MSEDNRTATDEGGGATAAATSPDATTARDDDSSSPTPFHDLAGYVAPGQLMMFFAGAGAHHAEPRHARLRVSDGGKPTKPTSIDSYPTLRSTNLPNRVSPARALKI